MRKEERKTVNRSGRIDLGEKGIENCRIANTSNDGALLIVKYAEYLPKTFRLTDIFEGVRRPVRVAWTGSDRAGVRFLDASARPGNNVFGRRRA